MGNVDPSAYLDLAGYVNPSTNVDPVGSVKLSANVGPPCNVDSFNISAEFCSTFSRNFDSHRTCSTECIERQFVQLWQQRRL